MPTTSVRDIDLILPGSYGKEVLSSDAFENLAVGISGAVTIALSSTNVTLTAAQAQRFVLIFTGTLTANVNVLVPAESRVFVADNRTTGAFTVTVKTASGGGVAVDQSARTLIYGDGTDVYPVASGTGGGGGSGAPTDATYLVQSAHALLTGERAVTDTATVTWDFATAGQAKAQIPDGAVTYAKLQDVTTARLLGRYAAGSGDAQEITLGSGLALDGSGVLTATPAGAQPLDATLTALAGLATGADQLPYSTGTDTFTQTPLTAFARTVLDDASQATMQGTLGVVPGADVQAFDATLSALAGVTTGSDRLAFFTGTDTASTTTLTPFARSLLDDTTAAQARATLGITEGGGAVSFLDLTDTDPTTYVGQAGKVVLVNAGETGLEFGTAGLDAEAVQDVVGAMAVDSSTVDFVYDDTVGTLTASVKDASVTEVKLLLADVTTANVSTTQHGLVPKAPGVATQYLDGSGAWSTPAGGSSGGEWTRVDTATGTLTTGLLAFWRMEETSGNRVDSVAAMALVPAGTVGAVTGKHGNAADFPGTTGNYLAINDNATLSIGAAQNFTIACWAYFDASSGDHCLVGKGNVTTNYDDCEFMLWRRTGTLQFSVANSTLVTHVNSGITPATGTWYFIIGWLDAANNLLWIQVNNGTPVSVACTHDSWDSTGAFEIGRQPGWSSSPILDGRVDNVMVYKRILTADERTNLWNAGLGLDYAELGSGVAYLHPSVTTDTVLAGSSTLTATEPLESAGGIKLGNSSGTTNGVIRYSGSDIEAYKGGAWVSLVGGTMAQQHANNVAITGGTASGLTALALNPNVLSVGNSAGNDLVGVRSAVQVTGGTNRWNLFVEGNAPNYLGGPLGIGQSAPQYPLDVLGNMRFDGFIGIKTIASSGTNVQMDYAKGANVHGLYLHQTADTGSGSPVVFTNAAQTPIGSISTTATATSFNTSSDRRLKRNVQPLADALATLRQLKPVSYFWQVNDEYGEGFLADELQRHVPFAVTGQPDAVDANGQIVPQGVDFGKVVPMLTQAAKELLAQVEALTARVQSLEEQLGI